MSNLHHAADAHAGESYATAWRGVGLSRPDRLLFEHASLERPVEVPSWRAVILALKILGRHRYVSVELENGSTVHFSRFEKNGAEIIAVHEVTERTTPRGARYSSIESRSFIDVQHEPHVEAWGGARIHVSMR